MFCLVSEINFQIYSIIVDSLAVHYSPARSIVKSSLSSSPLSASIISSVYPFTPRSKPTFSSDPSHLNIFSYPWTVCMDHWTGPDLLCSTVYF